MSKAFQNAISQLESFFVGVAEKNLMPDPLIRYGIRKMLLSKLEECQLDGNITTQQEYLEKFVTDVKTRNIAEQTGAANQQHYEVPTDLYELMLGPWFKYSSGYWPKDSTTLAESEEAMLELVCQRAELDSLKPGSTVLDLGCGWGSCALYIGKKYKNLNVVCVSNSNSQREYILEKCKKLGISNVKPETCDINVLKYNENSFDRICSTEMFEHMKNYEKLLSNISTWLKPDGKLFVHIFTHKYYTYHFEKGWMAETFFTGGTMPSKDLLLRFNKNMIVDKQWAVNGTHYSKTLEAWLKQIDANKTKFLKVCETVYGTGQGKKWLFNWRLFNLACSELFKLNGGNEWFVSHYLFVNSKKK